MRYLLAVATLAMTACPFDSDLPEGAVVLCTSDDECPGGWRCDPSVHECMAPGASTDLLAPTLQEVLFDPAMVADAPVELVITADEALAEAPTLHFAGVADPGFLLLSLVGPTARFTLDVSTVSPGAYPLGSVELTDERGNRATRLTPDRTLVVDRRAPTILDLTVDHASGATGLPFSPNPGTNELLISFVVDESVDAQAVEASAGPVAAVCAGGPANSWSCSAIVTEAFNDGRDRVVVTVSDAAGNRVEQPREFGTDLRPPLVVDAVTQLRSPAASAPVGAGVTGGTLELELILNEELGVPPAITVTGDVSMANARVEQLTPLRWRYFASFALIGAAGAASVRAQLQNRVGNVASTEVVVVPLALAVLSPCAPLDTTAICQDFDGDGDFALTPSCALLGGDCDDTDPLTRSDGTEIPGDGADNDCAGDGDALIDESTGVFVHFAAAPGGSGTRLSPANSIDAGTALLAERAWLFLGHADGVSYETLGSLAASVLGGLDTDWNRSAADHTIVWMRGIAMPAASGAVVVVDSVDLRNGFQPAVPIFAAPRLTLARSDWPNYLVATRRLLAVDSALHPLTIAEGVRGSLLARCQIHESVAVGAGSDLLILSSDAKDLSDGAVGPDVTAAAGARLDVVNSVVPSISCSGCTLRIAHSVIATSESDTRALVDVVGSPSDVDLINNIFYWPSADPGSTCIRNDSARLRVLGNLFFAPFTGSLLAIDTSFTATNVDVMNACGPPDCVDGDRNLEGDPRFAPVAGHIELSSPALGAAVPAWVGLPAALSADIDGDCRSEQSPEIGADEK